MKKMQIRVDRGTILMMAVMAWELWRQGWTVRQGVPVVVAILLHELAHVGATVLCGRRVRGMRWGVMGARLEVDGVLSYGDEWLIAAAGPTVNLLSAALVFPWWWQGGGDPAHGITVFMVSSVLLGVLNLLPIASLDGGRMLFCALARWMGLGVATGVLKVVSAMCLWGLWLVAAYGLLRTGEMLTLWVFATCLLVGHGRKG